jgi:putative endonuclease
VNQTAPWIVYILECGDGTLYTGIATDLARRLAAHESGRGARYTRGRGPFTLLYAEPQASRSLAARREIAIKALDRAAKLRLSAAFTPARGSVRAPGGAWRSK